MSAVYTAIMAWLKALMASLCVVQSITGQGKTERQETRQHNTQILCYLSVCLSVYISVFFFFFIYFPILATDSTCRLDTKHNSGNILLNSRSIYFQKNLRIERRISKFVLQKMGLKFFVYLAPQCALKCFTFTSHRQSNTVGKGHHPRCHLLIRNRNHWQIHSHSEEFQYPDQGHFHKVTAGVKDWLTDNWRLYIYSKL